MSPIRHRKLPVRATLICIGIGFAAFNILVQLLKIQPASEGVVQTVLLLVGVGVGGDTIRPSGMTKSDEHIEPVA